MILRRGVFYKKRGRFWVAGQVQAVTTQRYSKAVGSHPSSPECVADLVTNHATYGGNWLDRNLLLVGFPLAQDLVEHHARSSIFIRHHNISCSARSLAEAKSKLRRSLGGSLCRILHVNFPEQPYCEVGWIGLRLLGLLAPRVCLGTQP
jgi:hypothetical protein